MTQAQFDEFSRYVLFLSLVMSGISLLRYKRFGSSSLYLTVGFLLMALFVYGLLERWSAPLRAAIAVAVFAALFGDARSRFTRGSR